MSNVSNEAALTSSDATRKYSQLPAEFSGELLRYTTLTDLSSYWNKHSKINKNDIYINLYECY